MHSGSNGSDTPPIPIDRDMTKEKAAGKREEEQAFKIE